MKQTFDVTVKVTEEAQIGSRRLLVVMRESGTGGEAEVLLLGQIQTLVKRLAPKGVHLPSPEALFDLWEHPEAYQATVIKRVGTRAVLYRSGKVDILMSLGSARKRDKNGENAFIEILKTLIGHGQYELAITHTISRFCRNDILAGALKKALNDARTTVSALEYEELKVWEPTASLLLDVLVWAAALDAMQIEARTNAGKIARAARGLWTFGFMPPPGWKREKDGTVSVDPVAVDAMRWLLGEVATGNVDFQLLAKELARRGMRSRKGSKPRPLSQLVDPGEYVRDGLLSDTWLDVYAGAPYEVELPIGQVTRPACFTFSQPAAPIATKAQIQRVRAVLNGRAAKISKQHSTPARKMPLAGLINPAPIAVERSTR